MVGAVLVALPFSVPSAVLQFAFERAMTFWIASSSGAAVIAACLGIGVLCIPAALLQRDRLLALLFAFGCGAGLLSCVVLGLGILPNSALTRDLGWIVVFVSAAAGIGRIYALMHARAGESDLKTRFEVSHHNPFGIAFLILLVWALCLLLVTTFAPPLLFDVTEYHLGAWRDNLFGLKGGGHAMRFGPVPHNFYARFPFAIESLYWLGLVLSEPLDFAPKIINAAFVVACALLLTRMLRSAVSSRALALAGALLLLAHPVMREVSLDAFIDAPVAFLVLAAVHGACVLPVAELPVAFLLFGVALASKYTVAQIYLLPFLLIITALRRREWIASDHKLTTAVVAGLAVALPSIFWLGKNMLLYGNPLEPFFCWLFRPNDAAAVAREKFYITSHYPQPFWTLSYWTSLVPRLREFGWMLLPLACIAPLLLKREPSHPDAAPLRRQGIALLLFVLASYLLWNLVRESQNRFLLVDIALLIYLAIVAVNHLPHRYLRGFLSALLLAYTAVHLLHQTITVANAGEFRYLAEFELSEPRSDYATTPRAEFYRRNLGALGEILPEAAGLPRNSRILLVYEARPYLFSRDVVYNTVWDDSVLLRIANGAANAAEISLRLQQAGITHVLVNVQELRRYIRQYATRDQLRELGIGPYEDAAAAFDATPTPEDLFPPFYRSSNWKSTRAAVIEFLRTLRTSATSVKGNAPLEVYLAPLP